MALVGGPAWDSVVHVQRILEGFCHSRNEQNSHSAQKMLSMVLQLLEDSSKDETGVQWEWWNQHDRKESWYRALTRYQVSIR